MERKKPYSPTIYVFLLLILFPLAGGATCTVSPPAIDRIFFNPAVTVRYLDIEAQSPAEAHQQLYSNGPVGIDHRHHYAETDWQISWTWDQRGDGSTCHPERNRNVTPHTFSTI